MDSSSTRNVPGDVFNAAFMLTERIEDYLIDDVLADPTKLEAAYKQSARILHPDTGGSHEEFIALQASRDVLVRWHKGRKAASLRSAVAYDATDAEVEIGGILDRLGSEMQASAKRVRMAPYATIDEFVRKAKKTLAEVIVAGDVLKSGNCDLALQILREIDVPEVDFTDADEDQPIEAL